MKCDSGKHEWMNPVCRDRCCKPEWKRILRLAVETHGLDDQGRNYTDDGAFVHGWKRIAACPQDQQSTMADIKPE